MVVDLTATRCPELDPSLEAEFRRKTTRPKPDIKAEDGSLGHSKAQVREWIDRLEMSEVTKNLAGDTVVSSYGRCRVGVSEPPSGARPSS